MEALQVNTRAQQHRRKTRHTDDEQRPEAKLPFAWDLDDGEGLEARLAL